MTRRTISTREAAFRDALTAKRFRESAEEWIDDLPPEWAEVLTGRELDAICAYVCGDDRLEKREEQ